MLSSYSNKSSNTYYITGERDTVHYIRTRHALYTLHTYVTRTTMYIIHINIAIVSQDHRPTAEYQFLLWWAFITPLLLFTLIFLINVF